MIDRIVQLPSKEPFFLFGPRQTGKSTLIDARYTKNIWKVDLLLDEAFFTYSENPGRFRKEAIEKIENEKIQTIFIDEVQRLPSLLNDVQHLMLQSPCQFILTGSSARKLKRGGANLLAGRAVERFLHPLTYAEVKNSFNLEEVLLFGSLPPIWGESQERKRDILSTYVHVYLRQEIQSEGIVRNVGSFSRFLDLAASQFGEIVSYSTIGRECHLSPITVQSYYEILEDTLIGIRLQPWRKSLRKRLVAHPKIYFFDNGVTNAISKRLTAVLDPQLRGRLFEQWIIQETYRMLQYRASEANLYFWRTNHGAEVDLLIEKHGKIQAAVEIKSSSNIVGAHLAGLRSFQEESPEVETIVVATVENAYKLDSTHILPWQHYLQRLPEWL